MSVSAHTISKMNFTKLFDEKLTIALADRKFDRMRQHKGQVMNTLNEAFVSVGKEQLDRNDLNQVKAIFDEKLVALVAANNAWKQDNFAVDKRPVNHIASEVASLAQGLFSQIPVSSPQTSQGPAPRPGRRG